MKIHFKKENAMEKIILAFGLMLSIGSVSATPVCTTNCVSSGLWGGAPALAVGAVILAVSDSLHPQACDNEPVRHVTQAGKNYSFDVTGCEYKANKTSYIIVK